MYGENSIELYDESDMLAKTISFDEVESVIWRPDSVGFFVMRYRELAYYSIEQDFLAVVDTCKRHVCDFANNRIGWVMP